MAGAAARLFAAKYHSLDWLDARNERSVQFVGSPQRATPALHLRNLCLKAQEEAMQRARSSSVRTSIERRSSVELTQQPQPGKEAADDGVDPLPLRERSWGSRQCSGGGGGEDPGDLESGKQSPRRPRSVCLMLSNCFKVCLLRMHRKGCSPAPHAHS